MAMPYVSRRGMPLAAVERIGSIDVLRGIALAGVLLMNLLGGFRIPLSAHLLRADEPLGWGGAELLALFQTFIEFKAFTLFSFLLGVGTAIQAERTANAERRWFLIRRFSILLAFGAAHVLLLWNGDILTLYAICGLALVPLLQLPNSILLVLGLGLIVWPSVAPMPPIFPSATTLQALWGEALRTHRDGTWGGRFAFRIHEARLLIAPLWILSLPRTLGLMLWGVAAWQKGWIIGSSRRWRWALLLGVSIGATGYVLKFEEADNIGFACAYGAALLLWNPRAPWIAAAGQMALSNYLMQSAVFGFVFFSYGLRLFGRLDVLQAVSLGVLVYCLQLAASLFWLSRFRFGPFEWLWRSGSYLRWQPMLREDGFIASRGMVRILLVTVFVVAIPALHLGAPMLLSRLGPRWGWKDGRPSAVNSCGTVAIALGVWLLIWTGITMWRQLSELPRVRLARTPAFLLQTGPYGWTRHPMYLAESLLWIGVIVLLGSPVAAVVFAGLIAVADRWVIRSEERALAARFPQEYEAYCRRVPRLPRLWKTAPVSFD